MTKTFYQLRDSEDKRVILSDWFEEVDDLNSDAIIGTLIYQLEESIIDEWQLEEYNRQAYECQDYSDFNLMFEELEIPLFIVSGVFID